MQNEKPSFLRNHVDTLAIIGVNLAAIAILISMWMSATSRIDAIYSNFLLSQEQSNEKWNQINEKLVQTQIDNSEKWIEINEKIYQIWKEID